MATGFTDTLPRTILVVDDERLLRWSLARRLAREGYTVREAGSAREALEHVAGKPDLVLLDLRLPDSNGLELLGKVTSSHPACAVVMMSASASPELMEEAGRLGVRHFAVKPFDVEALVGVVERILR